ncbi:MAG: lysine--tRNA ligase [Candidatus Sungbacteria bacterium]|nr:lysine--tRNA ligase [Candidatus Sungbacteria bacterium]
MPLEDIRNERIKKLNRLHEAGFDSYPAQTARKQTIAELLKNFLKLARAKKNLVAAGRIIAKREHGGSVFLDLRDESGKIQAFFKKDTLGKSYQLFLDAVDIGDFLEVSGKLFKTKRGEPTIEASKWRMLAKSLRPLPEKWHGLQDVEERFRRRYLDILMNEEVRGRFIFRSRIIKTVREFFDREGFLEAETPILHPIPGGALARPFKTRHNALDIDLYLRIAPELYLKELLVGGFEKIYELGRSFRNEGIDVTHNPEFTMVEWYAAYWDENKMMSCVERAVSFFLKKLGLKNQIIFDGKTINFSKKFPRIKFTDLLKQYALIADYEKETRDTLVTKAHKLGVEVGPHEPKGKIADEIYKKICRPRLIDPVFVIHHPVDISPLAKKTAVDSSTVRRFQLIAGGLEIVNAFSELNDPLDQAKRFEEQEKIRQKGGFESHPPDKDFVEALEYGMPPAAGAAIGIDRLVMLLTDTHNIKEVVLFPTMRPK